MQLVDQGKVKLDDNLRDHIPEWPENKKKWDLRVEHVLSHTSGIRHYKPNESGTMKHYPTLLSVLDEFKGQSPRVRAGHAVPVHDVWLTRRWASLLKTHPVNRSKTTCANTFGGPAGMTQTRLDMAGRNRAEPGTRLLAR